MVEERIGSDFHLVKGNVRVAEIHADRRRIADEMKVVAARGKLLAQFRGDHSGTAICWIAGNADTHETASDPLTRPVPGPQIRYLSSRPVPRALPPSGHAMRVLESRTRHDPDPALPVPHSTHHQGR